MEVIINEQYMSPQEAATALGVSKQRIYQLVTHNVLEGIKYRHQLYITRASVAACDLTNLPGKGRPSTERDIERDQAIGARCRAVREQSGLRFAIAAESLKLSESALSLKERGKRPITALELSNMAALYGVSAKWLEYGGGE